MKNVFYSVLFTIRIDVTYILHPSFIIHSSINYYRYDAMNELEIESNTNAESHPTLIGEI